ncbi:MAG: hypothetical protein E7Z88_04905 [Cyanobacteria bacterium SIG27]|nr:hypothetical protein [Cyanobacteria bacterium SIG27]
MQISKINNISFAKKPILVCAVKDAEFGVEKYAAVYELDTQNKRDERYARFFPFYRDYINESQSRVADREYSGQNKRFYVLENPHTYETFGWAQTSHHYKSTDPDFVGNSTVIDEVQCDDNYENVFEPLLAAIANQAKANLDSSISLAVRKEEIPDAKNVYFSENYLQEQYIDKYRFDEIIEQAHESSGVAFFDYKI